jgi:hypothetical protein
MKSMIKLLLLPVIALLLTNVIGAEKATGKSILSKTDMDKLVGTWQGKTVFPEGVKSNVPMYTYIFRFEMSNNGELTGVATVPDTGMPEMPVTDMTISNGILNFKLPNLQMEFKGKLGDKEMVGELKPIREKHSDGPPPMSLTLKKGEYAAPIYNLSLAKETMNQLRGKWTGKIGSLNVIFRFEVTKDNDFVGFIDSPDQGAKGIPVTDAKFSDGELTLKANSVNGEYKGKLSGDTIVGPWIQNGARWILSLTKAKP